jgi:peptidyl-prolyl cis-trans isomerase SurA
MKRLIWLIPALITGLLAAQSKTVDRIMVQVNDDIITMSEFNRRMAEVRKELETKYTGEQLEQAIQKAEKDTLEGLIRDLLIYQKATELGYNSDVDARVSSFVQSIMKQNNLKDTEELEHALSEQGMSLKDFRDQVRREMIRSDFVQEYVGSRIALLAPEIEKFYKDHAADYTLPEEVTLSEIILNEGSDKESQNRANDLYRRLQQGEAFSAFVSQYSKGPTASKGGSIGAYLISKLNPDTIKAITNLKEGEISKPQKIKDGYVIYRIDARKFATVRPLAEVREEIRQRLYQQKFEPEFNRFIAQLKEDAYINYPTEIKQ